MATDYRIGIRCWQDQAGDEDSKINVYLNGTKVVSEAVVTGTNPDTDFNIISWESAALGDVNVGTRITIKVELANNLYVDSSTDRNVYINGIGYNDKDPDGTFKKYRNLASDSSETPDFTATLDDGTNRNIVVDTITDFTNQDSFVAWHYLPVSVTSSSLDDGWWDTVLASESFHTIPIWGDETDGVSIVFQIEEPAQTVS